MPLTITACLPMPLTVTACQLMHLAACRAAKMLALTSRMPKQARD